LLEERAEASHALAVARESKGPDVVAMAVVAGYRGSWRCVRVVTFLVATGVFLTVAGSVWASSTGSTYKGPLEEYYDLGSCKKHPGCHAVFLRQKGHVRLDASADGSSVDISLTTRVQPPRELTKRFPSVCFPASVFVGTTPVHEHNFELRLRHHVKAQAFHVGHDQVKQPGYIVRNLVQGTIAISGATVFSVQRIRLDSGKRCPSLVASGSPFASK